MPLTKITTSNEHTDCCTCGHTWALHSNSYGWCVLCDCKQYVQIEPEAEDVHMPKGKLLGTMAFKEGEEDEASLG